jgi:16S rRNA (guanine527-N7)-methyltransferase
MTPRSALERGVEQLALALPAGAREQLLQYLALLEKWNRIYNLTAIRDPLGMVSHHLLDSLAVLPHLPLAGLPGIPLAMAKPNWQVALIEANQKKSAFLRQARIELALPNLELHEGRIEAWQPAERFALVISRAFTRLADFVATCRHLVAPHGVLAAMKGKHPQAELAELPADVDCQAVIALEVPYLRGERHLVLCELRQ